MQRTRQQIEATGASIVLVHPGGEENAASLFGRYQLNDVPRVADPELTLYDAFELKRGSVSQIAGPGIWWKGFKTTILRGFLPGKPDGDVKQLPGTFLYHNGEILRAHRPANSADHPDFVEFVEGEC